MLAFLYSLVLTNGAINLDVTPTWTIEVNVVQIILIDYLIGTHIFLPCIKSNKPLIGFQISTKIISVISLKKGHRVLKCFVVIGFRKVKILKKALKPHQWGYNDTIQI